MKTHKTNNDYGRRSFLRIESPSDANVGHGEPSQSRSLSRYGGDGAARTAGRSVAAVHSGPRRHRIKNADARDGKSRPIVAMVTCISGGDGCARGGAGPLRRPPARPGIEDSTSRRMRTVPEPLRPITVGRRSCAIRLKSLHSIRSEHRFIRHKWQSTSIMDKN